MQRPRTSSGINFGPRSLVQGSKHVMAEFEETSSVAKSGPHLTLLEASLTPLAAALVAIKKPEQFSHIGYIRSNTGRRDSSGCNTQSRLPPPTADFTQRLPYCPSVTLPQHPHCFAHSDLHHEAYIQGLRSSYRFSCAVADCSSGPQAAEVHHRR